MSAVFHMRDVATIEAECWRKFQCQPVPTGFDESHDRQKRRKLCSTITDRYFAAIVKGPAPKSENAPHCSTSYAAASGTVTSMRREYGFVP